MIKGYSTNKNCSITSVDDTTVFLNLETGKYFTTNDLGSYIWEMLSSNTSYSIDEVVNAIIENYDIDINSARNDLDFFLQDLIKNEITLIVK